MIQRIQSVYLLLAAILGVIAYFMPFAVAGSDTMTLSNVSALSGEVASAQIFPWLLFSAILLTSVAIFLFKKRKVQIQVSAGAAMVYLLTGSLFLILADRFTHLKIDFQPWIALPFLSAFLCYAAVRGINKDEKLVRAADRLR